MNLATPSLCIFSGNNMFWLRIFLLRRGMRCLGAWLRIIWIREERRYFLGRRKLIIIWKEAYWESKVHDRMGMRKRYLSLRCFDFEKIDFVKYYKRLPESRVILRRPIDTWKQSIATYGSQGWMGHQWNDRYDEKI